ncbi:hypothetical protein MP228_009771 [Amoeboaphelidium protococcarum]|nr:hypothetical protein MP228_009771 [Amoeboaphelidium protococcarum]
MDQTFTDEQLDSNLTIPFTLSKDKEDGKLHLLVRPDARRLRQRVFKTGAKNEFNKCVLTGPSGAGKSLLLYLSALDCIKSQKWLVLYIADTKRFDGVSDDICARTILRILLKSNKNVFQAFEADCKNLKKIRDLAVEATDGSHDPKAALRSIHQEFFRICELPVFVGIDQWNCLQSTSLFKQDMLKGLFGHFSKFTFRKGYAMLAVSSSFNVQKSEMFGDFDGGRGTIHVPLYSKSEWDLIVSDYRQRQVFPPLSDTELLGLTGHVPRLLATVKQRFIENEFSWTDRDYLYLRKANRDYFAHRVKIVISRTNEKDVLEFSCRVCINNYQSSHVPSTWIDSGLFEELSDGSAAPIAPDVINAMYDIVATKLDVIMQTLAKTDAKGYAFQMFIQMGLERERSFQFPVARLSQTVDEVDHSEHIDMLISERIVQQRPQFGQDIPKYPDNSMIICYSPNHPVADVVVYSGGFINFISISISSYNVHRTKFGDLFTAKVGSTSHTPLSYYCLAAPPSYNAGRIAGLTRISDSLTRIIRFIFITLDTTKHNPATMMQQGAEHVYRINGEALRKFGDPSSFLTS